ncbi:MAG TPA: SpvB/TcaC N-terminal domain-containing protein [Solirubrobacteraceae bacterium]|nr:SpvB/TcaC N-terminal domain-containing protein [Solirubrobacteraceae bacterium]
MAGQNASDLISLPQGGGALAGIGETFQPDPHTGTGSFTVPLPLPAGRNGFQPHLSLAYSTGNPNGPFGLGWSLSVPQVRRKTSQGIPRYRDETDVFVLSGAEDLVPVATTDGSARYRPRTETGFARIVHVVNASDDYWEAWSKDGLRSRYATPGAHGAGGDPAVIVGPDGIFAWMLSETQDLLGNRIEYVYEQDPAPGGALHLAEVRYVDYGDPSAPQYLVSLAVTYEARPDPFSDRRPGFELRTSLRARSIAISTQADASTLATTVDLSYADDSGEAPSNGASLLTAVTLTGHDGSATQSMPPIELGYTEWQPSQRSLAPLTGDLPSVSFGTPGFDLVDLFGDAQPCLMQINGTALYWRNRGAGTFDGPRSLSTVPAGVALGAPGVQLCDIDGDGRPDLFRSTPTETGYWPLQPPSRDAGDAATAGFDPMGYVLARSAPTISLTDPDMRMIDLQGAGKMDILRTGPQMEAAYNDGSGTFAEPQVLELPDGLAEINFTDARVRCADMTGDGLTDIVLLHSGAVCYWPNLGYGRFGDRVDMLSPPRFEDGAEYDVTGFDPRRLLAGSVVGDGAADIVYVGDGHVTVWVNQSGNGFADSQVIPGTPRVSDSTSVRLADIYGNGVSGVLWSSDLIRPGLSHAFLDLTGGVKPYLLSSIDNHRGALTTISYSTSTAYAEADGRAGRPWRTTLPFPVHVVSSTTVTDVFSQSTLTTEYDYHHGYWDGVDREFRGFAHVDQRDAQTFTGNGEVDEHFSPPTETRTWFHVGPVGREGDWQPLDLSDEYWPEDPPLLGEPIVENLPEGLSRPQLRDACRVLRGSTLRSELYALDGDANQHRPYTVSEHRYEVTLVADPTPSTIAPAVGTGLNPNLTSGTQPGTDAIDPTATLPFFPHPIAERTTEWERGVDPRTTITLTDGYDSYGRAGRGVHIAVPRGPLDAIPKASPYLATATATSFATRDDDRYICDRLVATARYEIVNDGSMSLGDLVTSAADGSMALRPLGYTQTEYDGQPIGSLGDWGLVTHTEQLAITMGQLRRAYALDGDATASPAVPPYMLAGDAAPADGVLAEYFSDATLAELALTRPETTIGLALNGCAPDPVLAPGAFSARWTGAVNPLYSESYTFSISCQGAVRVSIGGSLVLDAWSQPGGGSSLPIALVANTPVALEVEYAASPADEAVQLVWSSASQASQPIPQARLTPPAWPVIWNDQYVDADYPEAFRATLPGSAGYVYHRSDGSWVDGYYDATERHYDLQDDATTGRGLLTWQQDALGNRTSLSYDQPYVLLPVQVTDPAQLTRSATYDYRVLKPSTITDANGNQTSVSYSPLGLPTAIAAMGKPDEQMGDRTDHPGTWFIYDFTAFDDAPGNPQPLWVHTIKRVEHAWTLINAQAQSLGRPLTDAEIAVLLPADELDTNPERFLQRIDYSDGAGRLLQTRSQADQLVVDQLGLPLDPAGQLQAVTVHQQDPASPRVLVSGWQAYDNKGRVVEKWEPCFAEQWPYEPPDAEDLAGLLRKVTTQYDPRGMAVLTTHPDGSQQRVVPGIPADLETPGDLADPVRYTPTPWETYTYDQNDEAGRTDPSGSAGWQSHWNTPSSILQDALGRTVQSIRRDAGNAPILTQSTYDIDGNVLVVLDPLGRPVSTGSYDLVKRTWRTDLLDAGIARLALDPLGGTLEHRDSKGALTLTDFDELHRQRRHWASDAAGMATTLREVAIYGEAAGVANAAALNLLGRLYESYDEAGRERYAGYDFQGNLLDKQRQVLSTDVLLSGLPSSTGDWTNTSHTIEWQPPGTSTLAVAALDDRAAVLLDSTPYATTMTYDAFARQKTIQAPLDVTNQRASLNLTYDQGGGLAAVALGDTTYVEHLVHNARGQRVLCVLGNGIMTRYAYDPDTFRLARLRSESCTTSPAGTGWRSTGTILQDHVYAYDQVGNLLSLLDTTPGAGVTPQPDQLQRRFTCDPLYRILSATGREADLPAMSPPWLENPTLPDTTAVRAYTESYVYDTVDNLTKLSHSTGANGGTYSRVFTLAPVGNKVQRVTQLGTDFQETYDACGNLVTETTSRISEWDHANRLVTYRTQAAVGSEPSVYAQYRYQADGQRALKIRRNQGGALSVTIYIDSLFERLSLPAFAGSATTSFDTLHIHDATRRVALVKVGSGQPPGDTSPAVLYQLGDHLCSSELVLDGVGGFVKREEFLPFGETSYGGYAAKRFRFVGKERCDVNGLYYHGARYYAPWLCRWVSVDPAGISDMLTGYGYVHGSPLTAVDPTGTQTQPGSNWELIQQSGLRQPVTARASSSGIHQWLRDAYQELANQWSYGKVDVSHTEPFALTPPGKTADTFLELASENRSRGATVDKAAVAGARASGQPTRVGGKWRGPAGPATRGQPPRKPGLDGLSRSTTPAARTSSTSTPSPHTPEPPHASRAPEGPKQLEFEFNRPLATEAASVEREAVAVVSKLEPAAISTTSKIASAASVAARLLPLVTLPLAVYSAERHWAHRDYFESILDVVAGVGGAPGLAIQLALTSSPAY